MKRRNHPPYDQESGMHHRHVALGVGKDIQLPSVALSTQHTGPNLHPLRNWAHESALTLILQHLKQSSVLFGPSSSCCPARQRAKLLVTCLLEPKRLSFVTACPGCRFLRITWSERKAEVQPPAGHLTAEVGSPGERCAFCRTSFQVPISRSSQHSWIAFQSSKPPLEKMAIKVKRIVSLRCRECTGNRCLFTQPMGARMGVLKANTNFTSQKCLRRRHPCPS